MGIGVKGGKRQGVKGVGGISWGKAKRAQRIVDSSDDDDTIVYGSNQPTPGKGGRYDKARSGGSGGNESVRGRESIVSVSVSGSGSGSGSRSGSPGILTSSGSSGPPPAALAGLSKKKKIALQQWLEVSV